MVGPCAPCHAVVLLDMRFTSAFYGTLKGNAATRSHGMWLELYGYVPDSSNGVQWLPVGFGDTDLKVGITRTVDRLDVYRDA